MKTFLQYIKEAQIDTDIKPAKSYTQYLADKGWKPFVFAEDFTDPLPLKKPKVLKKGALNRRSIHIASCGAG